MKEFEIALETGQKIGMFNYEGAIIMSLEDEEGNFIATKELNLEELARLIYVAKSRA